VLAVSEASIKSTVTNETESKAQALMNASGVAAGVILASNMVSSSAYASIDSDSATYQIIAQSAAVTVSAEDQAKITANVKLAAISSTVNDGGLSLVYQAVEDTMTINYTDRSGVRAIKAGDLVRVDSTDYKSYEEPDTVNQGDRVQLEFDTGGGSAGEIYEYIGSTPLDNSVSLDEQDYSDTSKWKLLTSKPEGLYIYNGPDLASVDLGQEDFSDTSRWQEMVSIDPTQHIPGLSLNVSDSDSSAFGGLIVRNDVRSKVDAHINKAHVSAAGDISVKAVESAVILSQNDSVVTSSGGSMFGEGSSTAVNAMIVSNLVLSGAQAYVTNSDLTAGSSGDVIIEAENTSKIAAKTASTVESNGNSIGVTLAFNTIGWESQNILFNAVDAICGTDIGNKSPATVKAWTDNTSISAAGGVRVEAISDATIDARIESATKSLSTAPAGGSDTLAIGGVIALNKVSTDVKASIGSSSGITVSAGDLIVNAEEKSKIDATVHSSAISVGVGIKSSSAVSVGLALTRNVIDNDMEASIVDAGTDSSPVMVTDGIVTVSAKKNTAINAEVTATAIAVAASFEGSPAVSGGGALAFNNILGDTNAFVSGSVLKVSGKGDVSITADYDSEINAVVHSVAIAVSLSGGKSAPAIAIGASVARNIIGWEAIYVEPKYTADIAADFIESDEEETTNDQPAVLETGDTVRVMTGPIAGDVYKYIGPRIAGTTDNNDDEDFVSLSTQNYGDRSAWQQINLSYTASQVQAYSLNSGIIASGDIDIIADSDAIIDANVLAGAAAVAASGKSGVSVSAAVVFTENKIATDVKSFIDGDKAQGIQAKTIDVQAEDNSSIEAVAGAASLAASLGGQSSVSVSIGMSIAFNETNNNVESYIANADKVEATSGDIHIEAVSGGIKLFSKNLSELDFSALDLEDAATDDEDDANDEAGDKLILDKLEALLKAQGEDIADTETVRADWKYTTIDGDQTLVKGERVLVAPMYENGGKAGRVYELLQGEEDEELDIDLSKEDYSDSSKWKMIHPELKLSSVKENESWIVTTGDGTTYSLNKIDDALEVSKKNINAISAAASLGVAIGGTTGVAVSGGGAVAVNAIMGSTNAYISTSNVQSAGDVILDASSDSEISATVVAASLAAGLGGTTGVGVSIGISVAGNFIGYTSEGKDAVSEVMAYVKDSSISAGGDLIQTATANQKITSI
ncbi:MAG: hypothetical protein HN929_05590, partial [Chloroflexi bacterium]|nr:hypothetical protein [Chloroflexota bacterium]